MNTEGPDQIRSTMAGVGTELGWVVRDHGYECLTIVRHFENREGLGEGLTRLTRHHNIMPTAFLEGKRNRYKNEHEETFNYMFKANSRLMQQNACWGRLLFRPR